MKINGKKTMRWDIIEKRQTTVRLDSIRHDNTTLESVQHHKLLVVWVSNDLTWKCHAQHKVTYTVASPKLYYLRQRKRCGVAVEDIIMFYKTVIMPVLEYSFPTRYTGLLTQHDSEIIESLQKRAFYVIF